jgi:DNA-binding MarR family transcriptional regulator
MAEPRPFREGILLQAYAVQQLSGDLLRAELGDTMAPSRFAFQSVVGTVGPLTPGELARRLGMAPTTVSSWIGRLESEGALTRKPNTEDRRSVLVALTPLGREQLDAAMPHFRRAYMALHDALGDDADAVWHGQALLIEALRTTLASSTPSQ